MASEKKLANEKNELDELTKFLLSIAKQACPKKFYPFPEDFRTVPADQVDDAKEVNNNMPIAPIRENIITENKNKIKSILVPYAEKDYLTVKTILDSIDFKLVKSGKLSEKQSKLMKYIMDLPIKIKYHGINLHPDITEFEFKYEPVKERLLDDKYKKRWYLFHGSKSGNWHSILRNGIKNMSGTSFMGYGAALGAGVYLTSDIKICYHYGSSKASSYVAVVEILEDPTPYYKGDAVYVIPKDDILIPRYLYKIKKYPDFDAGTVLKYYKALKEKSIDNSIKLHKRINYDMEEMKSYVSILDTTTEGYILLVSTNKRLNSNPNSNPNGNLNSQSNIVIDTGIIVEITLNRFPYMAPIITLKYKLTPKYGKKDETNNYFKPNGMYIYKEMKDWTPYISLNTIFSELQNVLADYEMSDKEYI